ncbi:MAG TPA: hypothetical protein VHM28_01045, partial [Anaerolineales bacterium]|nr:hypothetical protein [Anaerolineales bacterium]
MKHFSLLIAFSILLSACGQGSVSSAPSATPSETFVPPPSATATETPLPTATITPTLSLDPMIYQFDSNVSPEDQALVRQGVQMARYYLIQNFGSDITKNYLIKVIDNPNDKRPEGHTDIVDGQEVFTENMGHPYCKENYPERCLFSVTFEVTHLWQSEQGKLFSGCLYTTEDDPVYGFLVEGQSRYVANMLVKNGEELIDANALGYWMRAQFNDRNWLNGTEADGIAVKHLI